jgi:hypothetical protein
MTTSSTICDATAPDVLDLFPPPDPRKFPTLTGRQAPHHLSIWPGEDTHGFKAIRLGERVVQPMMPWQHGNLRAILRCDHRGRWTHGTTVLICTRQNGKSEIMLVRCLYGLFVLGEKILYTVQRWDTGKDLHTRLVTMINSVPSLKKRLACSPTLSQGRGTITLDNGAQIVTSTRSADTGRGLTRLDLLVYDEGYNLGEEASAAVDYAQLAAEDPQTIYTSSAVNAAMHSKGNVLAGMRRLGLARAPRTYFAEYMAPEGWRRDTVQTWEYANPSYGIIATAEKMGDLLRKATSSIKRRVFEVEALGWGDWPRDEDDVEAVITAEVWHALKNREIPLRGPVALALSMTRFQPGVPQMLSIAAAQATVDDRIHVEVGYHGTATGALTVIRGLVQRWNPCAVVIDSTDPAMALAAPLIAADIEPETTTAAQKVQACGGFYQDAIDAKLTQTGDPLLEDACAEAGRREVKGGGWAWEGVGISPLDAVTLARWGLVTYGSRVLPAAPPPVAIRTTQTYVQTGDLMGAGF